MFITWWMDRGDVISIYAMEFHSAVKRNGIIRLTGKWMEMENVILGKVTLVQKDKHWTFSCRCRSWLLIFVHLYLYVRVEVGIKKLERDPWGGKWAFRKEWEKVIEHRCYKGGWWGWWGWRGTRTRAGRGWAGLWGGGLAIQYVWRCHKDNCSLYDN